MENLYIKATSFTPAIGLDKSGELQIIGRSTSENALDFYRPALQWLREYIKSPSTTTTVTLKLDYFNSSSSKCLLDIIKTLAKIESETNMLVINWVYQRYDLDMRETGEDFASLSRVPFNFIENDEIAPN